HYHPRFMAASALLQPFDSSPACACRHAFIFARSPAASRQNFTASSWHASWGDVPPAGGAEPPAGAMLPSVCLQPSDRLEEGASRHLSTRPPPNGTPAQKRSRSARHATSWLDAIRGASATPASSSNPIVILMVDPSLVRGVSAGATYTDADVALKW